MPEDFRSRFAQALDECKRQGTTQRQLAAKIAAIERDRRDGRPGQAREAAIARGTRRWEHQLSDWRNGRSLPATPDQLHLALDVIARQGQVNVARKDWEGWWHDARGGGRRRPVRAVGRATSAHMSQVKEIAPPELRDREGELAELAAFCTEPDAGPYLWCCAEAWSGKSALMATLVTRPPEPIRDQVRFVSFFVRAGSTHRDVRADCATALWEQLAELTRKLKGEWACGSVPA